MLGVDKGGEAICPWWYALGNDGSRPAVNGTGSLAQQPDKEALMPDDSLSSQAHGRTDATARERWEEDADRRSAEARTNIRQLGQALGLHKGWLADLAACTDAATESLRIWGERRHELYDQFMGAMTAAQGDRFTAEAAKERLREGLDRLHLERPLAGPGGLHSQLGTPLHAQSVAWLICRYWRILQDAHLSLQLPPRYFATALGYQLDSSWETVIAHLEKMAWSEAAVGWGDLDIIRDERDLRTLMEHHAQSSPYPFISLPPPPPGMAEQEYRIWVTASIHESWPRLVSPEPQKPQPIPGSRRDGRPSGGRKGKDYLHRITLYNLWQEKPTGLKKRPDLWQGRPTLGWEEFHDWVNEDPDIGNWSSERDTSTLEHATEHAILWAAPAPGISNSLKVFTALASVVYPDGPGSGCYVPLAPFTPPDDDLSDEMRVFFATYRAGISIR